MYQQHRRAALALGLGFGLAAVAACSDSTASAGRGTLRVQLTDAPFPFDSVARVDMYVARIDARTSDATESEAAGDTARSFDAPGTEHGGWITIASPRQRYNLLDLQNGTTTNLGQLTIPTGSYRAFRLVLNTDSSSVTLKNGTVLSGDNGGIKFPSAGRSGVKVVLDQPIAVTENGTVMVLDFDVGRSFVLRGNSLRNNGLLFKPVIRASARDITGSLSGVVRADSASGAAVADATVEVLKAGTALADTVSANVVATTRTDATGAFHAAFLLPGSYTLRATAPAASGYGAALYPNTVAVSSGADAGSLVLVVPKK